MKKIIVTAAAAFALSSPALASEDFKAGDWMIRARALGVVPQESSTVNVGGTVQGHASVENSLVPELDISYFFTPEISVELIAAVTPHDVTAIGSAAGARVDVGSSWLLPPTLTLQYHFNQLECVKPYVGAGVNYTHFFSDSPGALSTVNYSDSFGAALQAGIDIPIRDHWYLNFDVKKIFIDTTAKFNGGTVRADVNIDPWLIGVGIGYKF